MKTDKSGNQGAQYVEWYINRMLGKKTIGGDNLEKWDNVFEYYGALDYKEQTDLMTFGGVSIEIAECNPTFYNRDTKQWYWGKGGGKFAYATGIQTSRCNYYAFTDLTQIWIISTKILKSLTNLHLENNTRLTWGGNNKTSFQWQLKIEELHEYSSHYYDGWLGNYNDIFSTEDKQ